MKKVFLILLFSVLLTAVGCALEDVNLEAEKSLSLIEILSDNELIAAKRPQPMVWVDGMMFSSVVTPANFKPESDPFDELYAMPNPGTMMPNPFKDGVPLISESKPGDKDYNGGRWHMNVLKGSVDPKKYEDANSDGDLDLADFMSTQRYFECPLIRVKK